MKLVGPLMLCLPGIIALHISDLHIEKQDQVYGAIVRHVLPNWSLGLFAAVLMGSILSSFKFQLLDKPLLPSSTVGLSLELKVSLMKRTIDSN